MRIVVIGGGTAGQMAVAQINHFFPDYELFHIFDSSIRPIGVGEGTLPFFVQWINQITGKGFETLAKRCEATLKYGIQFEGWGNSHAQFQHIFAANYAYHISADKLVEYLQEFIRCEIIDQRVIEIVTEDFQARVRFDDGTEMKSDFVLDARGFPRDLDGLITRFSEIPTNAALIRGGAAIQSEGLTRAVARPHGWVFVIPLASRTSYGYVFNEQLSTVPAVESDFDQFLARERVELSTDQRLLKFPSFMQKSFFDGVVFKIGNQASFLEPLEATAIGIILEQLKIASYWLAGGYLNNIGDSTNNGPIIQTINQQMAKLVRSVSLFVSWHYAMGSVYDTVFWKRAEDCYRETYKKLQNTEVGRIFNDFVTAGKLVPIESLASMNRIGQFPEAKAQNPRMGDFGGFSELNFAQIGQGIGYYRND